MERKEVPRLFFSDSEKKRIAAAIKEAELKTSAEIVVRVEKNCPGNPLERCRELLQDLGLTSTTGRTGVIILITVQDHKVAVFGDEAIDREISHEGWEDICAHLVAELKKGEACDALVHAIQTLGDRLSVHFPYKHGDIDELPNEPSYSEEH
jgi:uncharacterized membrane protein